MAAWEDNDHIVLLMGGLIITILSILPMLAYQSIMIETSKKAEWKLGIVYQMLEDNTATSPEQIKHFIENADNHRHPADSTQGLEPQSGRGEGETNAADSSRAEGGREPQ